MTQPVCTLELARLRRDPIAQTPTPLENACAEAQVPCGQANASYASGAPGPPGAHSLAACWRGVVGVHGEQVEAEPDPTANTVDPVFQVMPSSIASGPYSVTGEPVFPVATRPTALERGDVMWVDTGINLHGYASDFGATWFIGTAPDAQQRDQF